MGEGVYSRRWQRFGAGRVAGIVLIASGLAAGLAAAQSISRVSVDSGGAQANGASTQASVSADGRYVAFTSTATNLMPAADTNLTSDVFVKDRQTGAITRVSVKSDGTPGIGNSESPSISADGRYVAFSTTSPLVADDTQRCDVFTPTRPTCSDIYVHDRVTHETTRVSLASDSSQGNNESFNPHISADGRYVVFESYASNLVPSDTNGAIDVFVRDRQLSKTTLVTVAAGGAPANGDSSSSSISDDGSIVAFLSRATNLDTTPDTLSCAAGATDCDRLFVRVLSAGTTTRAPLTSSAGTNVTSRRVSRAVLSHDGQAIGTEIVTISMSRMGGIPVLSAEAELLVYALGTGEVSRLYATGGGLITGNTEEPFNSISVSGTGRVLSACDRTRRVLFLFDRVSGLVEKVPRGTGAPLTDVASLADCDGAALSGDGNIALFSSSDATLVSGDTNGAADVFAVDRDPDHDGMPSEWETKFGLDPANPADASLDPDGDGKTNLQEFQAGTHPKGAFTRYLAEGAMNQFFDTTIHVFNPATTPVTISVHYLGENGRTGTNLVTLAAKGYVGIRPGQSEVPYLLPDASFSTVVESDQIVAVERTMTWNNGLPIGFAYGAHAETAITNPSTTWYFAEGATHGAFDLFYLLQNPNAADATVTITYLLPAGQPPIVLTYLVAAHSRRTIWVDQEPGLGATDVSAKIESNLPIFTERALYLSTATQTFAGGTDGAGLAAPATKWFVAEGATGGFFDLFILIGNPSTQDASVTVTYLLPGGTSFDKVYPVAKQSRLTISVDGEDPRLAGTSVSAIVTSTNSVPIVVERSMWWPSPNWYEGSLTAATTDTGMKWALAGGYTAFDGSVPPAGRDAATYLLVANPSDTAANVTFDLLAPGAGSPAPACQGTIQVPAHGRSTIEVKDLCENFHRLPATAVVGTVSSDGPQIVVERATYWSTPTQFWSAGASTLLTKIQ